MSLDPRLDLAQQGNPNPQAAAFRRLADLERRMRAVEQATPAVQVNNGVPTTAPREGTLVGNLATSKLLLFINGAWQ